jgi:hypothetical protein
MAELSRWLEEDEEGEKMRLKEDPWKTASSTSHGAIVGSPVEESFPDDQDSGDNIGFDDDFTVFISAPAEPMIPSAATPGTPTFESGLTPSVAYHSLGSQSDLGDLLDIPGNIDSDDDDLPSRAEVQETAARIFGPNVFVDAPELPETFTFIDEDSSDFAPFDLSRVLGALEGIKAEIATMDDEGERRRAAAKAALGLVYGLQQET